MSLESSSSCPSVHDRRFVSESRSFLAEFVGEESLRGQFVHTGVVLKLMDNVAGMCSFRHTLHTCVTLSFDSVVVLRPLHHGDLCHVEGEVIAVGRSSVVIRVNAFRQDFHSKKFTLCTSCHVTMVALDHETRRPVRSPVPRLVDDGSGEEIQRQDLLVPIPSSVFADDSEGILLSDEVEDDCNKRKSGFVRMSETEIVIQRMFLPKDTNRLDVIYGGTMLELMERVASNTGRYFTQLPNSVTVRMHRILFKRAVQLTDAVRIVSRVVYVRNTSLMVHLIVYTLNVGRINLSHEGYFTVAAFDDAGFPAYIDKGLVLEDSDQDSLREYNKAIRIYHYMKEKEKLLLHSSSTVSAPGDDLWKNSLDSLSREEKSCSFRRFQSFTSRDSGSVLVQPHIVTDRSAYGLHFRLPSEIAANRDMSTTGLNVSSSNASTNTLGTRSESTAARQSPRDASIEVNTATSIEASRENKSFNMMAKL